jgi:HEAT repeat protein
MKRSLFKNIVICATCLLGILAVAACDGGPKPGEEADYYGKKFFADIPFKQKEAALNHLTELKDKKSLPHLYKLLEEGSVMLRPRAVQLISKIGGEDSLPHLIAAIDYNARGKSKKDKKAMLANERIATALGRHGSADDKKVVDNLIRLTTNTQLNTRLAAVTSLGRIKAGAAVIDLMDIATNDSNNFIVKNAVEALGLIADPQSIPALIKLMFFERYGVSFYREASFALFIIGKPALNPLFELYDGKFKGIEDMHISEGVRKAKALQCLMDIGNDARVWDLALKAAAVPKADRENGLARVFGQEALGRVGDKRVVKHLLPHWDDTDTTNAETPLNAMVRLGQKKYAKKLYNITTFSGFVSQCTKVEGKEKLKACEKVAGKLRSPRVDALSRLAPASMLPQWEKMIAEEKTKKLAKKLKQGKSRLEAAKACSGKGEDCWIAEMKNKNPQHRERAAYELLWDGTDKSTPVLLEALGDPDNETRFAAIMAIWRRMPKEGGGADRIAKILAKEKGNNQYVRINEDLKRLKIKLDRGY